MKINVGGEMRMRSRRPWPLASLVLAVVVGALGTITSSASAISDTTAVTIPGNPLTVYVGPRGQCQSSYVVNGELAGNYFYGPSPVGDCGFFLAFPKAGAGQPPALQGQTFGFKGGAGPDLSETYTTVSQSAVSGSGTASDPYTQTTIFKVVDSEPHEDALVTETTTYVNGSPQFTSTYNVRNTSGSTLYFRAMYAGDLYVNGDDHGTGVFLGGPPRFIGGQNTHSGILGGFQEAPSPALPWSAFQEAYWSDPLGLGGISAGDNGIWHDVETSVEESHAFNETIEPNELDNGAGVEWDQLREAGLEAGHEQAFTIINRTTIPSGLQINPANQTLTVGQTASVTVTAVDNAGTPYSGRSLVYSIGGSNPKSGSVVTNAAGQATISYVGTAAGLDTMQIFLDLAGTGTKTPQDPTVAAQVTWLPAPPAPNSSYKVQSIHANSDGTITIVFVPAQDGTATLEVTVPTASISRNAIAARKKKCKRNQIRIKGKCRPKTTVSGKLSAGGKAGVPLKLTVKPSGKVKKALAKGRTVQLTAKLTYRSKLGGSPTVQTFHLKVKGKKKRHHH